MNKNCRQCGKSAEHYASIPTCCKECWKERVKKRRNEKITLIRAYDRERSRLPHRKAAKEEYRKRPDVQKKLVARTRKARQTRPGMLLSHNAVMRGIKSGKIIRPDHCTRCLVQCVPQGHHDDYSKPLDVMWLCTFCHAARHIELGRIIRK
jgi:hypothetical protein